MSAAKMSSMRKRACREGRNRRNRQAVGSSPRVSALTKTARVSFRAIQTIPRIGVYPEGGIAFIPTLCETFCPHPHY
jgi:hypothetical protein